MRKTVFVLMIIACTLVLSSCSFFTEQLSLFKNPLEDELAASSRIVFTNNKENALRFTIADPKVVEQVASIMSRGKKTESKPDVDADYSIVFYCNDGTQYSFSYWMGASENGMDVNLKDNQGNYLSISDSLDTYITNSTKMSLRPEDFVRLYSSCISDAISTLEPEDGSKTTVGVDIESDRRMRRYTMSYEEKRLMNSIKSDKLTVLQLNEDGKYTYVLSFLTTIYNVNKAEIKVNILKTSDQTKQTVLFKPTYSNGVWQTNRVIDDKKS